MKKVEKISKEEKENLKEIKKHHPKYRVIWLPYQYEIWLPYQSL